MKLWLQGNNIGTYSRHNKGKSVVAERFIRTLKNNIYRHMISISKNGYIEKVDDIVNEYNNTYSTIKTKPVGVKPSIYIDVGGENNDKVPQFEADNNVRISKYKNCNLHSKLA